MTVIQAPKYQQQLWTLIEFGEGEHQQRTLAIPEGSCIVGRASDAGICLPLSSISKHHARLFVESTQLYVVDLGSKNGTYVNGERIAGCCGLVEGDLVQFANSLFRIGRRQSVEAEGTREESLLPWAQTLLTFDRLLSERRVIPFYQPIITLDRRSTPGFEVLARSDLPELKNPAAMFGAAERLGQHAALSELMRTEGIRIAASGSNPQAKYFLNTHPAEVVTDRLIDSLHVLRKAYPDTSIMIEIHEAAVTDPAAMKQLRRVLNELGMGLSYDDFGAGQGRLVELGEVPPDVLKFDMQLIRDIHLAPASRQEMLRALVKIAKDLGCQTLAEGVETEPEHEVCRAIGFDLGQGYLYGRPNREIANGQ